MKSILTLYFVFIFLFGCSGQDKRVNFIKISPESLPEEIDYKGKVKLSVKWNDKNGKNIMIVTEFDSGKFFTPSWKSKLFAWQYIISNENVKMVWDIWDFAPKLYYKLRLIDTTFDLTDLNNDGYYEPSFIYNKVSDGLEPKILKLMMFNKGEKFAIRGVMPRQKSAKDKYEKNIDPSFENTNLKFKEYASKKWDDYVIKFKNKYWKQE